MALTKPQIKIVSMKDVNASLIRQSHLGGGVLMATALMENNEPWTLDDVASEVPNIAAARLELLERLEALLNAEEFLDVYKRVVNVNNVSELEASLFEVLYLLRTSRFEVILRHIHDALKDVVIDFPEKFVRKLYVCSQQNNIAAHVLFERVGVLARMSAIHSVFSADAAARVNQLVRELHDPSQII